MEMLKLLMPRLSTIYTVVHLPFIKRVEIKAHISELSSQKSNPGCKRKDFYSVTNKEIGNRDWKM